LNTCINISKNIRIYRIIGWLLRTRRREGKGRKGRKGERWRMRRMGGRMRGVLWMNWFNLRILCYFTRVSLVTT